MKLRDTMVVALFALAGCQSVATKKDTSVQVDPDMDRCGASEYQQYVGQPLSSIDDIRFEHPARAVPYDASVSMDFNLNRLNFMGDSQGKISRVYCG